MRPRRQLFLTTALLGAVALSAGGCMNDITGSTGALSGGLFTSRPAPTPGSQESWRREVKTAGERYDANPRDLVNALRYAEALRKIGQRAQAVAVLRQASIFHPRDKRVLGDYGRALADTGNLKEAFDMLGRAHAPDQPDWRVLSAQGAVLDQMGRHEEARRYYANALNLAPDEPSVLSNLGLSYALSKELAKAEETLRKAAARGSGEQRVRQNLALVVGLQGRFEEAEKIASADLPPQEAAENMAYLRQMLPRHATSPASAKPAIARPKTDTKKQAAKPTNTPASSRPMMLGAKAQ